MLSTKWSIENWLALWSVYSCELFSKMSENIQIMAFGFKKICVPHFIYCGIVTFPK
jgi:hypothetical protein